MNISIYPLSLFFGAVSGILAVWAFRNPFISLVIAISAVVITENILRAQNKS